MARIDAGKATLDETEFDLADSIEATLRLFHDEAKASSRALRLIPSEPRMTLRADERLVRQVVINLISNSLKFTKPGGSVDVRIERTKLGGVDLVVTDDGIGIAPDKLEHVMEPFGQAADAFSRAKGGVGLGLPIVKSLVELHGGKFSLESKVNVGTTARVHLPPSRVITRRPTLTAAAS
jgi:two-component system cell cycle sensor histidine kinase PleC